mmetsp:Transcript_89317/g.124060  ORF Transcript_89317/g.124060 Transcript_89317/m.124060 type:complete len:233 (-) Transcript_89317:342-1040(-)
MWGKSQRPSPCTAPAPVESGSPLVPLLAGGSLFGWLAAAAARPLFRACPSPEGTSSRESFDTERATRFAPEDLQRQHNTAASDSTEMAPATAIHRWERTAPCVSPITSSIVTAASSRPLVWPPPWKPSSNSSFETKPSRSASKYRKLGCHSAPATWMLEFPTKTDHTSGHSGQETPFGSARSSARASQARLAFWYSERAQRLQTWTCHRASSSWYSWQPAGGEEHSRTLSKV